MPTNAAAKVAVVWRGDRAARDTATPQNNRFYRVFEELAALGIAAEPAVYDEPFADEVRAQLLEADGVLVWVDPLRTDTDFVASLRYTAAAHVLSGGAVHLRIEEIAPNPAAAASTADALTALLNVLRAISLEQAAAQTAAQPPNPSSDAIQAILNSVTLSHHESRAELNANASLDQLKALTAAHDPAGSPLAAPPDNSPATPNAPAASK